MSTCTPGVEGGGEWLLSSASRPPLPLRCLDTSSASTFLLHLLELQVSDNSNREPTHPPTLTCIEFAPRLFCAAPPQASRGGGGI